MDIPEDLGFRLAQQDQPVRIWIDIWRHEILYIKRKENGYQASPSFLLPGEERTKRKPRKGKRKKTHCWNHQKIADAPPSASEFLLGSPPPLASTPSASSPLFRSREPQCRRSLCRRPRGEDRAESRRERTEPSLSRWGAGELGNGSRKRREELDLRRPVCGCAS